MGACAATTPVRATSTVTARRGTAPSAAKRPRTASTRRASKRTAPSTSRGRCACCAGLASRDRRACPAKPTSTARGSASRSASSTAASRSARFCNIDADCFGDELCLPSRATCASWPESPAGGRRLPAHQVLRAVRAGPRGRELQTTPTATTPARRARCASPRRRLPRTGGSGSLRRTRLRRCQHPRGLRRGHLGRRVRLPRHAPPDECPSGNDSECRLASGAYGECLDEARSTPSDWAYQHCYLPYNQSDNASAAILNVRLRCVRARRATERSGITPVTRGVP